jgi:hypothetical protein
MTGHSPTQQRTDRHPLKGDVLSVCSLLCPLCLLVVRSFVCSVSGSVRGVNLQRSPGMAAYKKWRRSEPPFQASSSTSSVSRRRENGPRASRNWAALTAGQNAGARVNGKATDGTLVAERHDRQDAPTLADTGLTGDESSRYQAARRDAGRAIGGHIG